MWKYALAGLLAAGLMTLLLAGPLLSWVGRFGNIAVLSVALAFRLVVLVLVVWLGLSLLYRGPGRMSSFL
jgi:hypothetical protein